MSTTPTDDQSELVAFIHNRGGSITARQLQRTGPRQYRGSAEQARDALEDLATVGLATMATDGRSFDLQPNAQHWLTLGKERAAKQEAQRRAKEEITSNRATPEGPNTARGDGDRLDGLDRLPTGWPDLPPNATLQAEVGWVQSQRLAVVQQQPTGRTVVHLDRASEPPPSKAALGWLETSIRSYAKYVDVVARALKDEEHEAESTRRERMRLDEIDALLAEMWDDTVAPCPHCGHKAGTKPDA